jgi:RND family efflux transporter MFP subunit
MMRARLPFSILPIVLLLGCGADRAPSGAPGPRSGGRNGGGPGAAYAAFGADAASTAVPVEVQPVLRRTIADYLETNGTLEAENEVDIVARIGGPIVELNVEEGMTVRRGEVLARIDADELLAQLGVAKVALEEARLAYDRAKASHEAEIISQEFFDQAKARYDSAAAQLEGTEILLGYTTITAPFDGIIVERSIKYAGYVTANTKLFRISDFIPLLCPIQLPEKDLRKLRTGQRAFLTVEAFPGQRFAAEVLRISPVVDAATGTMKVTLETQPQGKLRPGMFASVYLEVDRHEDALVIPKRALVLESIGDTVYVMKDGVAERRDVELGFEEADAVEVLVGVEEGERAIVVGQDGLSSGTPVYVLSEASEGERRIDPASMTPEQIERMKERMRQFGLSDAQIEERIQQMKDGTFSPPGRLDGERRRAPRD